MNLKEFTEAADQMAGELSREELLCLLHSLARKVPEENREDYLTLLEVNRNKADGLADGSLEDAVRKTDAQEIKKEYIRLTERFEQIQEETLCLRMYESETYTEYWNDDPEWKFEDPQNVCGTYEEGCAFVQHCVNDGFYKEARELFDFMMDTEVWVDNEWDAFGMDLNELEDKGLVSVDLNDLALNVLYAVYQVTQPEDRAEEIYDYFSIQFFTDIRLEGMLGLGKEELAGLPEFWDSWIKLLTAEKGDLQARLLKEAVLHARGAQGMPAAARLACETHPSLYVEALESFEAQHDYGRQLEAGREALEKIGKQYVVRGEAALLTAEAALRLGDEAYAENCWLEAFRSDSTPVNYLRIMAESREPEAFLEPAGEIIRSLKTAGQYVYGEPRELALNELPGARREILAFLNGDFEEAMDKCCHVKQALGWTGKFVKPGIALFLLLLQGSGEWQQGCRAMAGDVQGYIDFKADKYCKGTRCRIEDESAEGNAVDKVTDYENFRKCFLRWKALHPLSQEQTVKYVSQLETLIDKRVKAIITGKYRAHYWSVAALAAALGEVKEALGECGAKEKILQGYRLEFSRYYAFHEELRRFGMRDTRKGVGKR